jgi:uncharacterized protein (UPF0216 family)
MTEESSDRILEEYFSTEFRVLNAHLPKLRKPLTELIKEEHPCVLLNDGSAHFFKRKELEYLVSILSAEEQEKLTLPILIEITPGQSDIGVMAGGQGIEAKVLAEVVGMSVVDDKGNIRMYKSQLGEIRSKLKTTTQYLFSTRDL